MAISYSMCWEDPLILSEALEVSKQDSILSIVSGGENILSLLLKNPNKIVGIDIKKEQIYLTKLKISCIKNLEFDEFARFIGIKPSNYRLEIFNNIKKYLEKEEAEYWENHLDIIKIGVINCGKFERYLAKFRKYCLPLIISKKKINKFLLLDSVEKQERFYKTYWDNWRFRLLFKIFFSKKGLEFGRDKQYFKHSSKDKISDYYLKRVKHSLTEIPVRTNFFMHYILTGTIPVPFKDHPYLDKSNFNKLKDILNHKKIEFIGSDIHEFLKYSKEKLFSKFNLSDIFEAKTQEEYESLLKEIVRVSKNNSIVCYWNNLANKSDHCSINNLIKDKEKSEKLYKKDRVHFYSRFIVETIN
jgi:S-adenosylmethionine-diacylglycerol 3-amino-3-carboxypropyl transferase